MSLKGDAYETTEEVKFRLEGSVVLYDGDPVYITRVNMPENEDGKEVARVFFSPLPYLGKGKGEVRKFLSSKKFDLAPFRMGYVNHKGTATFVSRLPVRQNRQGLSAGSCGFTDCSGNKSGALDFAGLIQSQGFVDMVKDVYPTFQEVGELLGNNDHSSVAVSKTFAFRIDHDLEALVLVHKGVKCGLATRSDKALRIPSKFHFLRQEMEAHRIPIA